MLERHWELANRRAKTAQIVVPWYKLMEVLAELHGGPLGGHPGVNKTLEKVRRWYYQLQL
jgi:hypothetical protein